MDPNLMGEDWVNVRKLSIYDDYIDNREGSR